MNSSSEVFRADCVEWNGYSPCPIQKSTGLSDCLGCDRYEPGPPILDIG